MGEWIELRPAVWDTVTTSCDCCGKVVPRRVWRASFEGREMKFCSEECELLYSDYKAKREHGDQVS
jgi:hypothetical protein